MGLQSVDAGRFDLFSGVTVLLAMVVAGISTVGAAVFTGFFLGGPSLANLFPTLTQLTAVAVASAAVGVGRNPNGIIAAYLRPQWDAFARAPRLLAGLLGGLALLYGLRLGGVLDNWGWVVSSLVVIGCALAIGQLAAAHHGAGPPPDVTRPAVEGPGECAGAAAPDRPVEVPGAPHGRV